MCIRDREEVAAGGPVARLVDMFVSRLELVQHTTEARPFDDTFCDRRGRLLDHWNGGITQYDLNSV